jgi:SAM-dependent MidA family methyltransferase
MSQGEWLTALGIAARAESLMAKNPASATQLYEALERLVAPDKMGTLFKALAFLPNAALTAPGFEGRRYEAA